MSIIIRQEEPRDFRQVEEITRRAFWNIYVPGCDEHYLVHIMRIHHDFIPELDLVIEKDGHIVGNIIYTKSVLLDSENRRKYIATFGPISIDPSYQHQGLGKKLLEHSMLKALEMGFGAIVIYGNPGRYVKVGFKSAYKYGISTMDGSYPTAMLAIELINGFIGEGKWKYSESPVYEIDKSEAELFDKTFEEVPKEYVKSQEEFYILSHSKITG